MTLMTVSDLMSTEVVTVTPESTLQDVIATMVRHGIRHIPIVENDEVIAVVSDRNIRVMISGAVDADERRRYLTGTQVMAHASRPVTTVAPSVPAHDLAKIFIEERIGCLPVVDENERLIGIVTQTDLLQWLSRIVD